MSKKNVTKEEMKVLSSKFKKIEIEMFKRAKDDRVELTLAMVENIFPKSVCACIAYTLASYAHSELLKELED